MMSLGMRVQSQAWRPALAKPQAAADPQVKGRAFRAGASVAMLGASAILCHHAARGRRSVCAGPATGRVVVTGGCGYIGSHTVLELLKADYEVLVLDNLSRSHSSSIGRVLALAAREHHLAAPDVSRRLAFKQVDLCDVKMLENVLAGVKECDAVLHFAGYKSVGESMQKPDMYWDNNVGGFVNLMFLLEKYQVSNRILLSSSCTVYKPSSEKISEDSELQPTCPYGDTKLKQEQILQSKIEDGRSWNGCALRYFNPAGAHNSGLLGEVPHALSPCMFIPRLGQIALGQRPKLEIFGKDYDTVDGTAIRDYLHIQDLAEAHVAALEHLKNSQGFDAFNLGTGHGHTVLEVLSAFESVCGQKLPCVFSERRHGDAPFAVANPSRAHSVLGWRAHRSLPEILSSHWEFVQQNFDGFD